MAFKGQLSYYQFKTNIKNGSWYIEIPQKTKDILDRLGLTYDDTNKTLSGLITDDIPDAIDDELLDFIIYNDDRSYGQEITFKLLIVAGEQQTNSKLKPRPIANAPSYSYNVTIDPTVKTNNVDISLANFSNMDGTDANDRKYYNISSFPANSRSEERRVGKECRL